MSASAKDYRAIFMFPEGERVLDDLMEKFAGSPFVAGQPDTTAYKCGTKAVLEHILSQIDEAQRTKP